MPLSAICLAVLLFLLAAGWLAWFTVSFILLGVLALVTAIVLLYESLPLVYQRHTRVK